MVKRIQSREVLYCAVLLHDMAKGLPGDHSDVGAEIARSLCPRLGMSPSDTLAVAWLVKNHLVMSDIAQRRDVSDPQTVRDFVAQVQSPEMLRLMLILTVADIRAVGPGVWNGWKGQLLRELYYAAEYMMTGGDQLPGRSARVAGAKAALAARLADFTPEQRERAINRHYDNYWLAFETDEQERHARAIAKADAAGELLCLEAVTNEFRAITEIMLYTPDHPGLFSQFAGAIAMSGGSIVDAKVFTTTDGFALDVFSVQDAEGEAFGDSERLGRLRQTIAKTLRGEIWPRRELMARRPCAARPAPSVSGPRCCSTMKPRASPRWWRWNAWTGRACFMTSPRRFTNPGFRSQPPWWPPMASGRWTFSMCATALATRSSIPTVWPRSRRG